MAVDTGAGVLIFSIALTPCSTPLHPYTGSTTEVTLMFCMRITMLLGLLYWAGIGSTPYGLTGIVS